MALLLPMTIARAIKILLKEKRVSKIFHFLLLLYGFKRKHLFLFLGISLERSKVQLIFLFFCPVASVWVKPLHLPYAETLRVCVRESFIHCHINLFVAKKNKIKVKSIVPKFCRSLFKFFLGILLFYCLNFIMKL